MRTGFITTLLATLALCGCSGRAHDIQVQLDDIFRDYRGDVPGVSILVMEDGLPVVRRNYGLADLERKVKTTAITNYRLASMTKQFTAAAILLLMEQGKLDLDDPLQKWLPSLPGATRPITLRHLLMHTSGLIDYEDVIPEGTTQQVHDADVLKLLETQDRLNFAPGTQYRYSNSGYSLLSLVVAKASGQDFATFRRDRIFQPLRMSRSVAYEEGVSTVAMRAYGYSFLDGAWKRTDQSLTSAVLGDGGIYSSIDDLARWDKALTEGQLLKPATWKLAFMPATSTDDPAVKYGFGWRLTGDSVWHSGETLGFRNVIVRFPAQHLTVVVLTNRDEPEPYFLALKVAKLYYPEADRVHATTSVSGPDSGAKPLPKP